ncbi:hypothetical protein F511_25746 [Dorcoceras hygrometricum]|uniref:Uncharacterized protein n=1 Tax=Dorcoceras hygrometricum TaxID=472368 RepID=A0A2Z7C4K9_9LAMI|nr:hypothetical protein F511_25746 [Dorcoceras hygrometricum]
MPKNLKISKSTKIGPTSNIGPKTGLPGTGPNITLEEFSRHDIAGASSDGGRRRRPPPQNHTATAAQRRAKRDARPRAQQVSAGQWLLQPVAQSCAKQRPASATRRATSVAQRPATFQRVSPDAAQATSTGSPPSRNHALDTGQRSCAMRGQRAGVTRAHARGDDEETPPSAAAPWPMQRRFCFVSILKN